MPAAPLFDSPVDRAARGPGSARTRGLAIVLVASIASAPLAVPALLNVVLLRKPSRRAVRWAVAASAMAYLAMFIASLFFHDF